MTKTIRSDLTHGWENCPADRVETTEYDEPRRMTTVHCLDCGAHAAYDSDGDLLPAVTQGGPFYRDPQHPAPGILDGVTLERDYDDRPRSEFP